MISEMRGLTDSYIISRLAAPGKSVANLSWNYQDWGQLAHHPLDLPWPFRGFLLERPANLLLRWMIPSCQFDAPPADFQSATPGGLVQFLHVVSQLLNKMAHATQLAIVKLKVLL